MPRNKAFNEQEVLSKAINLFQSQGYNGTSAQDLVDKLDISRSSLYDTFGDKHGLFIKALQQYQETESGTMIRMLRESTDVFKTLKEIFDFVTNPVGTNGCLMVNSAVELALHDKQVASVVTKNMVEVEKALEQAFIAAQKQGVLSKRQSALAMARYVFNTISGLRVASRTGIDKRYFKDVVDVTLQTLKA